MQRVRVELKKTVDESYDMVIERGGFRRIVPDLKSLRYAESWVVVTDSRVSKICAKEMCDALKREKIFLGKIVVTSGEQSKCMSQVAEVMSQLVEMGANRKSGIVALGGGVIGDLAGFCAAIYMRGIPFVQVPTTLLAMVDSSVGGKTGVDLPEGKNMVGVFWQPKKVYVDVEVLRSLPMNQWKSGLGECVKYGAIRDRKLWDFFEAHVDLFKKSPKDLLLSELGLVEEMIKRCVEIKAEVVSKDEKESGLRVILNYGHTFGHVVELMSGYMVPHGEAVAVGMRMAGALANRMKWLSESELKKQNDLLDQLGLGKTKVKGLVKDFVAHMKKDKKASGSGLKVVIVDRIGCTKQMMGQYAVKVTSAEVSAMLKEGGSIDDEDRGLNADIGADGTRMPLGSSSTLLYESSSGNGSVYESSYEGGSSGYGESAYRSGEGRREESDVPPSVGTRRRERRDRDDVYSGAIETDLQCRLRKMRERRERMGGGGFLP